MTPVTARAMPSWRSSRSAWARSYCSPQRRTPVVARTSSTVTRSRVPERRPERSRLLDQLLEARVRTDGIVLGQAQIKPQRRAARLDPFQELDQSIFPGGGEQRRPDVARIPGGRVQRVDDGLQKLL